VKSAIEQNCTVLDKNLTEWQQLNQQDVPAFNGLLTGSKLPIMTVSMGGCKQ
jgi:hypothetical protein